MEALDKAQRKSLQKEKAGTPCSSPRWLQERRSKVSGTETGSYWETLLLGETQMYQYYRERKTWQ